MDMERELLLLGMLRVQAMHGYQLHELIDSHFGESIQIKKSTAYSLLAKMTDAGWVSHAEERAGNRPLRRVYTMTEAGEVAFQRLIRQSLADYGQMDSLGSIALAFVNVIPSAEVIGLLRQRRNSVDQLLQTAQSNDEHDESMHLMVENQIRHVAVELEWLDEVIGRMEAQQTEGGQSIE